MIKKIKYKWQFRKGRKFCLHIVRRSGLAYASRMRPMASVGYLGAFDEGFLAELDNQVDWMLT